MQGAVFALQYPDAVLTEDIARTLLLNAAKEGVAVTELKPKENKANQEITALYNEIFNHESIKK